MNTIPPITKSIYICDDVTRDPKSGKVSVNNIWEHVRVPMTSMFPFVLNKITVFVWWRGGLGTVNTQVRLVDSSTGEIIRLTQQLPINFKDQMMTVHAKYLLQKCVFQKPGVYFVELFCNNEFVDDQAITVTQESGV